MKHDDIQNKIKEEDKRYADLCKVMVVMYLILSVIYILLIVLEIVRGAKFEEVAEYVICFQCLISFSSSCITTKDTGMPIIQNQY